MYACPIPPSTNLRNVCAPHSNEWVRTAARSPLYDLPHQPHGTHTAPRPIITPYMSHTRRHSRPFRCHGRILHPSPSPSWPSLPPSPRMKQALPLTSVRPCRCTRLMPRDLWRCQVASPSGWATPATTTSATGPTSTAPGRGQGRGDVGASSQGASVPEHGMGLLVIFALRELRCLMASVPGE